MVKVQGQLRQYVFGRNHDSSVLKVVDIGATCLEWIACRKTLFIYSNIDLIGWRVLVTYDIWQSCHWNLYHLESKWRNSHVLVYHGPLLIHILGVAPSTFSTVYQYPNPHMFFGLLSRHSLAEWHQSAVSFTLTVAVWYRFALNSPHWGWGPHLVAKHAFGSCSWFVHKTAPGFNTTYSSYLQHFHSLKQEQDEYVSLSDIQSHKRNLYPFISPINFARPTCFITYFLPIETFPHKPTTEPQATIN